MKAIEIVSIPVSNQQRAKQFYLKLGFTVLVESPHGDGKQKWIQMGYLGTGVSITLVTWFPKMPSGCVQYLVIKTDNIQKDIEDFTAKDIKVGEIEDTPWGKFLWVQDPDGNGLTFHEENTVHFGRYSHDQP